MADRIEEMTTEELLQKRNFLRSFSHQNKMVEYMMRVSAEAIEKELQRRGVNYARNQDLCGVE